MHLRLPVPVLTLLLVASLAGCVSEDPVDPPTTGGAVDGCLKGEEAGFCGDAVVDEATGRDLRVDLTAEDQLKPPVWEVGDVFEQHLYFGSADETGEHIKTMVVNDAGSCYEIATSSVQANKMEAVYDYPVMGCIGKRNLETAAFGTDWAWMYEFPLEDGKTWTATIESLINFNDYQEYTYEATFSVAYEAAIDTPAGDFPGFWITVTTADGDRLGYYNYVPAVGWFSHFWLYDVTTEDPEDVQFHAMSMGTSEGYAGPYLKATAEELLLLDNYMFPPVDQEGNIVTGNDNVQAVSTFTVSDTATDFFGFAFVYAIGGSSDLRLVSPSGEARDVSVQNPAMSFAFELQEFDEAPEPGQWGVTHMGAGFGWGAYVWLHAVTQTEHELTADMLPGNEATEAQA